MFMRPIRVSVHKFISAKARSYVRGPSLHVYEQSSEAHGCRQWRCRADVVFGQSMLRLSVAGVLVVCWWHTRKAFTEQTQRQRAPSRSGRHAREGRPVFAV